MLKNLALTSTLVFCFAIYMLLARVPQGSEFLATVTATLAQVSNDLPVDSALVRAARGESPASAAAAETGASSFRLDAGAGADLPTKTAARLGEPDCCGWNE